MNSSLPSELIPIGDVIPRIEIHTSDRILFRRCRRKWYLQSGLRRNLCIADDEAPSNPHLWFGSGIHFALEDYHGHNRYGNPILAFQAYCYATRKNLPTDYQDLRELGDGILSHYGDWARRRDDMRTWWCTPDASEAGGVEPPAEPMVEVNFHIPLFPYAPVYYSGTFDRIVVDPYGRFWIVDYKTAQRFNTSKLEMDPQVSAYCWAFRKLYGTDAEGVIYIQMLKSSPHLPYELTDGTFSCNKSQDTTYALYRAALIAKYGNDKTRIPRKNLEFASWLREQETPEGDKFIRRDLVRRNEAHIDAEEWKIYAEAQEMLNSQTPLYPNATRDCSWDCPFTGLCVAMDDGSDHESIIENMYTQRKEIGEWRSNLPTPEALYQIRQGLPATSETELKLLFQ